MTETEFKVQDVPIYPAEMPDYEEDVNDAWETELWREEVVGEIRKRQDDPEELESYLAAVPDDPCDDYWLVERVMWFMGSRFLAYASDDLRKDQGLLKRALYADVQLLMKHGSLVLKADDPVVDLLVQVLHIIG